MPERDAIVLGAGPAGCAAAVKLASMGHRVAVILRPAKPVPCPRIETLHHPDLLGHAFTDYRPGPGVMIDPGREGISWWTGEGQPTQAVAVIDRAKLDAELGEFVRGAGIEVIETGGVQNVSDLESGQGWTVRLSCGGEWRAPFVIDATGRHSSLRRRRALVSWKQTAVTAEVTGRDLPPLWTESLPGGWLWAIQWQRDRWVLSTFTDPGKTTRAALLASSRFACGLKEITNRYWTTDAAPAAASEVYRGAMMIHTGDAALSRDPLATQGLAAAVSDGLSAATAVHSLRAGLTPPELVQQYLAQRHDLAVRRHERFLAQTYSAAPFSTGFWLKRSGTATVASSNERAVWRGDPDEPLTLSSGWRLEERPVLEANCIRTAVCLCSSEEAVSWLGGCAVEELLQPARAPRTTARTMMTWWAARGRLPAASAPDVLRWLASRQVLVPAH